VAQQPPAGGGLLARTKAFFGLQQQVPAGLAGSRLAAFVPDPDPPVIPLPPVPSPVANGFGYPDAEGGTTAAPVLPAAWLANGFG
jgi:hypothetical protein